MLAVERTKFLLHRFGPVTLEIALGGKLHLLAIWLARALGTKVDVEWRVHYTGKQNAEHQSGHYRWQDNKHVAMFPEFTLN